MKSNPIKIVLISFEMHPVISARSFRTTELAKQFVCMGHDVTLYTVWRDDNFNYENYAEETGITLKNLGKANFLLGNNIIKKLLNRIIAYPMIQLIPMIKRAIKEEGNFDYLVTIAAPHPIHWGASFVKNLNFKCWTADCGDPYMKNPYAFHPFYFKWIEKKWCRKANYITVPIENAVNGYYEEFRDKIKVIPQGFNFEEVELGHYEKNIVPTFAFAGTCYKNGRDITKFLEFLQTLPVDFKFIVYSNSMSFFENYEHTLKDKMTVNKFIPRKCLLKELSKVDFLINIRNDYDVQSPSKLIDYSLANRPILEIGSAFGEKAAFLDFLSGNYEKQLILEDISKYDIKNVAASFINLYHNFILKD